MANAVSASEDSLFPVLQRLSPLPPEMPVLRLIPLLLILVLSGISPSPPLRAETGESLIFNRFSEGLTPRAATQDLFEIPVLLRPQGDPNASLQRNWGLGYVSGSQPGKS
ncbi:MAG: hypothetical protein OEW39_16980, partial [Deltaproteobacteria bacterium]|nr:hypothetical protein [Deltaproteobacteria bacterium]